MVIYDKPPPIDVLYLKVNRKKNTLLSAPLCEFFDGDITEYSEEGVGKIELDKMEGDKKSLRGYTRKQFLSTLNKMLEEFIVEDFAILTQGGMSSPIVNAFIEKYG